MNSSNFQDMEQILQWLMPGIPALETQKKKESYKFKASLGYIVSSVYPEIRPVSKKSVSKCKTYYIQRFGRFNTIKKQFLPEFIYKFNLIHMKIEQNYLVYK